MDNTTCICNKSLHEATVPSLAGSKHPVGICWCWSTAQSGQGPGWWMSCSSQSSDGPWHSPGSPDAPQPKQWCDGHFSCDNGQPV